MGDDVTAGEQQLIRELLWLRQADPATAQLVAALPWVGDDVTVVELFNYCGLLRKIRRLVAALPWVGDDVTDIERRAIQSLLRLAEKDLATAQLVAALPWVGDGMTNIERWAIHSLRSLASATARLQRTPKSWQSC